MIKLNGDLLKNNTEISDKIKIGVTKDLPIKVLQFGEGNFLRGFVDWMFNKLNENDLFNGKIVIAQPLETGLVDVLNQQDGLYTLLLRGLKDGKIVSEKEIITSVDHGLNIYKEYDEYIKLAENPELRVIVSNTTEAGIAYKKDDKLSDSPQSSFPGKLTALLYKRFTYFKGDESKGFILLPCELIDRNGDKLKNIVLQYANDWNLGDEFVNWLNNSNYFLNTLVDRIVTGYPKDEIDILTAGLGYQDNLIDTGEIFHLWVIEGDIKISKELPFHKIGINVVWTNDMTPYRARKVSVLNGAHTMTVLAAYLFGLDTVKECIDNKLISDYMKKGLFEEIIPTLEFPKNEVIDFANSVIERFANPFIKHNLLSISLNSVSKFKTRVLPSLLEYVKINEKIPEVLSFSLASLIAFYKSTTLEENKLKGVRNKNTYNIIDDISILKYFKNIWSEYDESKNSVKHIVTNILSQKDFWDKDLNNIEKLNENVTNYLFSILTKGMEDSIVELLTEK
ncbi:MAG: tagaturonate reductase [Clostridiales bacterium]